VTKRAAEHLCTLYTRAYGVPVASMRYFTVYGPRQRPDMAFTRFIEAALRDEPISLLGTGEQSRDFTFVHDAVDATYRALSGPPGSYNVGGGSRATVNEAIAIIEELTGRAIKVERADAVRGDMEHTWADTTVIRNALGWAPRASLRDGLAAHVEWARARLG
jgi:nucleoside-diphosphate-sugar epimerase